ncbi:MAG: ComEC/Rec2 family competence protein [Planctomycetes bacterium]|nr:ComEC/Rec2 family competence protein [Planctomycetota bacterium]
MLLAYALGVLLQSLLAALLPSAALPAAWCGVLAIGALLPRASHALCLLFGVLCIALFPAAESLPTNAEIWPICIEDYAARSMPATADSGPMLRLHGGLLLRLPASTTMPPAGARVRASGWLAEHGRTLRCIQAPEVLEITPRGMTPSLLRIADQLGERLGRGLDEDSTRLLRALLLGDSSIDPERRDALMRTGTLHFFAISGMHLVMLLGLAQKLLGRRRWFLLGLITFYAALCGFGAPIQRAFLCSSLFLAAGLMRRPAHGKRHWVLALATVALACPEACTSASFWLTFAATAGILWGGRHAPAHPEAASLTASTRAWVGGNLRISLCASSASAAVTAVFFRQLTPAAIPGSLLLAPVVTLLMLLALCKIALPDLACLAMAIEGTLQALDVALAWLEQVPCGNLPISAPSVVGWIGCCASLALLIGVRARWTPFAACALMHLSLLLPAPQAERTIVCADTDGAAVIAARGQAGALLCGSIKGMAPSALRQAELLHIQQGSAQQSDAAAPERYLPNSRTAEINAKVLRALAQSGLGISGTGTIHWALQLCPYALAAQAWRHNHANAAMAAVAGVPLQNAQRGKPLVFEPPAAQR